MCGVNVICVECECGLWGLCGGVCDLCVCTAIGVEVRVYFCLVVFCAS